MTAESADGPEDGTASHGIRTGGEQPVLSRESEKLFSLSRSCYPFFCQSEKRKGTQNYMDSM
jgi:hypothetical protein